MYVLLFVCCLQCQQQRSYQLHMGQPFYSLDQPSYARFLGMDILRNQSETNSLVKGIYTSPDSSFIQRPMLRFYEKGTGLKYALLSKELDAHDGDLVEVRGEIREREFLMENIRATRKESILEPDDVCIVSQSSRLRATVQHEYHLIKEMLQKRITPERSRLILPDKPRWYIVWSVSDGLYIISTRAVDLMYQAEIDFVWDAETKILKDVYAVEWFKGE